MFAPSMPSKSSWGHKRTTSFDSFSFPELPRPPLPTTSGWSSTQASISSRKSSKRLRDFAIDQVDSALKKLRFSEDTSPEKKTHTKGSYTKGSPYTKSSALLPTRRRHRRKEWNASDWYSRRSTNGISGLSYDFKNLKSMDSPFDLAKEHNIHIQHPPSPPSPTTLQSPCQALVLYKPIGTSKKDLPALENEEEGIPGKSQTLYSSPRCTIELLPDEDRISEDEGMT